MKAVKEILEQIADADKYLKKHKDPNDLGGGVWQTTYEQRGRLVHELRRQADLGSKKAEAAWKQVNR